MKISEAIDRLEVGDTVWVKGKVSDTDKSDQPLYVCIGGTGYKWLGNRAEISLTEPQAEKVVVPEFVAEWYETNKASIERAVSMQIKHGFTPLVEPRSKFDMWFFDESNHPIETLIRMKDGYTVKPKRWVVKLPETGKYFANISYGKMFGMIAEISEREAKDAYPFDDRAKAEAVAVLVEGTVEEV